MSYSFKNILRQPLIHFLLIGALLFVLYKFINPELSSKDVIVIDDEQVSRIELLFAKEWNRNPTAGELKGLLEKEIQEEVYYRKALSMNLDHNDEIIRRRLNQKLQFITNDLATLELPTDDELKKYYAGNKKKYLLPEKYSFTHIYFSPDKRKDAKADAAALLQKIPFSDITASNLLNSGDPFPLATHIKDLNEKEIAGDMGEAFAAALKSIPLKKWTGPLQSGYGEHLIFVEEKIEQSEPSFESIRDELTRDYQYQLQVNYNNQLYREFKKDYEVRFDIRDPKRDKKFFDEMIEEK